MPVLKWNEPGDRVYESGLDRGVIYLPNGTAVPWNGLREVVQKFEDDIEPVYFDGAKISDVVTLGSFLGDVRALTYPKELDELDGNKELRSGAYLAEQKKKTFGFSYRSRVGNDTEGDEAGYKIHIIYNVTAIAADRSSESASDDIEPAEFEWELFAAPEHVEGFRPSAHMILKTKDMDPLLLEEMEKILYGDTVSDASLIPMSDLLAYMTDWFRIKITDNGDGTWTASSDYPDYIFPLEDGLFMILHANAVFLDEFTYVITDTKDIGDAPNMKIIDHGNGVWTASTSSDYMIDIDPVTGYFEIREANVEILDADTYRISDTA